MKLSKLMLAAFLLLSSISSFAIGPKLEDKVLDVLVAFESGKYKVEQSISGVEMLYLDKWPTAPYDTLEETFMNEFTWFDAGMVNVGYEDPSGEYGLRGRILRSLEVSVGAEKVYIAYYKLYGGEWGREEVLYYYYVMDEDGIMIDRGQFEE